MLSLPYHPELIEISRSCSGDRYRATTNETTARFAAWVDDPGAGTKVDGPRRRCVWKVSET